MVVSTHASQLSSSQQVLLMTCRVIAEGHDGSTYQARELLDSTSSASFVSELLAQHLHLPRHNHSSKITGNGGGMMRLSSCGSVDIHIKSTHANERLLKLKTLVLQKITSDASSYNVMFDGKWKHLTDLELADSDLGTPGSVDMLLGADIFSRTVLYGCWLTMVNIQIEVGSSSIASEIPEELLSAVISTTCISGIS